MIKGETDRLLQHFPTKQSSARLLQPVRSGPAPRRESLRISRPYHVSTDLSTAEGDGPETGRMWVHKIEYLCFGVDLFMVFTAASNHFLRESHHWKKLDVLYF